MTNLASGRWRNVRVPRRADDVLNAADRHARHFRYAGERAGTVVREVAIDFPRLAEVVRALDEHGRRPERLKVHDHVRKVELGFEVQLYGNLLAPVLRLPPSLAPVWPERRYYVLDVVAGPVVDVGIVRATGIAHETLVVLVLQMADDAETFRTTKSAGRGRR